MTRNWKVKRSEGVDPIELKFIDLFMALIGSMIFIAFIFAMLSRETNRASVILASELKKDQYQIASLEAELDKLRGNLAKCDKDCVSITSRIKNGKEWFDGRVVGRWVYITLKTYGCKDNNPEMYVRPRGELFDTDTGDSKGEADLFDAGDIVNHRTNIYGFNYSEKSLGQNELDKIFYGVVGGKSDIYVGLEKSKGIFSKCVIYPEYHYGPDNNIIADHSLYLTQAHPYAILAHINVDDSGEASLDIPTVLTDKWKAEINKFSADQNINLDKIGITGTSAATLISKSGNQR